MHHAAVSPLAEADIRTALKTIVAEIVHLGASPESLSDTADLYESGLDSTSVVDLVLRIEERFEIAVPDDALDVALFQNLERLTDLVVRTVRDTARAQETDSTV